MPNDSPTCRALLLETLKELGRIRQSMREGYIAYHEVDDRLAEMEKNIGAWTGVGT